MAVETTNVFSGPYTGTGAVDQLFPVTFQSGGADQVSVYLDGVLVNPTAWTFDRDADGRGSVVATLAGQVYIFSDPTFAQGFEFQRQGPFFPSDINPVLDQGAVRDQYLKALIDKAVPPGALLPGAGAGKYVVGDASGNPVYSSGTGADAGLRTDLATAVGATMVAIEMGVGADFQALTLETALRLGLPVMPEHFAPGGVIDYDDVDEVMDAFAGLSAHLQSQGGGDVALAPNKTYMVGRQVLENGAGAAGWMFYPDPIIRVTGAARPIIIDGRGARLKCAPDLLYGTFDENGDPLVGDQPLQYVASPYIGMIDCRECTGGIFVHDIDLDGSIEDAVLGGGYGGIDRQIPAHGLFLIDNEGPLSLSRIKTHHHCLDGYIIRHGDPSSVLAENIHITEVDAYHNARQGLSLIGGRGGRVSRCKFNDTGQTSFSTAPRAGLDLEAEGSHVVRDWTFEDCEFSNNTGVGMVADVGDNADVRFRRCTFIGTENWALWPKMPGLVFEDCVVVGCAVNTYVAAAYGAASTRYTRCRFTNDTSRSPTGDVYLGSGDTTRLLEFSGARHAFLTACDIDATGAALALYLDNADSAIIADTRISQASATSLTPTATWAGTCSITGGGTTSAGGNIRGRISVNSTAQKWSDDVDLKTGQVFRINGTQVLGAPGSAITDASVAHALNPTFSNTEVETALNALGTKINTILARMRAGTPTIGT